MSCFPIFSSRPNTAKFISHIEKMDPAKPKSGEIKSISKYIKCAINSTEKMNKFNGALGRESALNKLESHLLKSDKFNKRVNIENIRNFIAKSRNVISTQDSIRLPTLGADTAFNDIWSEGKRDSHGMPGNTVVTALPDENVFPEEITQHFVTELPCENTANQINAPGNYFSESTNKTEFNKDVNLEKVDNHFSSDNLDFSEENFQYSVTESLYDDIKNNSEESGSYQLKEIDRKEFHIKEELEEADIKEETDSDNTDSSSLEKLYGIEKRLYHYDKIKSLSREGERQKILEKINNNHDKSFSAFIKLFNNGIENQQGIFKKYAINFDREALAPDIEEVVKKVASELENENDVLCRSRGNVAYGGVLTKGKAYKDAKSIINQALGKTVIEYTNNEISKLKEEKISIKESKRRHDYDPPAKLKDSDIKNIKNNVKTVVSQIIRNDPDRIIFKY